VRQPHWLWDDAASFPPFVTLRTLARYKTPRRSTHGWALDSGGFSEVSRFREWLTSPGEYVAAVARHDTEIGNLHWAAPRDWMCEREVIHGGGAGRFPGTYLSVAEHQVRTVTNFLHAMRAVAWLLGCGVPIHAGVAGLGTRRLLAVGRVVRQCWRPVGGLGADPDG
jgi:hypothetical protein